MNSYIISGILFLITIPIVLMINKRFIKLQNLKWWNLLLASVASAIAFEAILIIFKNLNFSTESPAGALVLVGLMVVGMLIVFHLVLKIFVPDIKPNNSIILGVAICAIYAILLIPAIIIFLIVRARIV